MDRRHRHSSALHPTLDDAERLIEENGALRLDLIEAKHQLAIAHAKIDGKRAEVESLKRELARFAVRDAAA